MKFNKCILRYAGTLVFMMTACLVHADDRPNIVIILADVGQFSMPIYSLIPLRISQLSERIFSRRELHCEQCRESDDQGP